MNLLSVCPLHNDDHRHAHAHGVNRDHDRRAACAHILSDAATGLLAIGGLVLGRTFGWPWLDPIVGLVGASMILRRALVPALASGFAQVRAIAEADGTRVAGLHLWRPGPENIGQIPSFAGAGRDAAHHRRQIPALPTLSHVTVETLDGGAAAG